MSQSFWVDTRNVIGEDTEATVLRENHKLLVLELFGKTRVNFAKNIVMRTRFRTPGDPSAIFIRQAPKRVFQTNIDPAVLGQIVVSPPTGTISEIAFQKIFDGGRSTVVLPLGPGNPMPKILRDMDQGIEELGLQMIRDGFAIVLNGVGLTFETVKHKSVARRKIRPWP